MFAQTLLTNVSANEDTNNIILDLLELENDQDVQYHVYEVAYEGKRIFCCLSGGIIENNEIEFTPVGLAAFEAMTNIVSIHQPEYYAEEISLENGDVAKQLEAVFQRVPDYARVCFVGNINDELREELSKHFTLIH